MGRSHVFQSEQHSKNHASMDFDLKKKMTTIAHAHDT